jgi:branched-chain amino acid transport system substrate-binding protein
MTALVGLFALVSAAGCSGEDAEEPIKIGVLFASTGVGQVYGAPALRGAEIMAARINAEGGLLGRQVEIVFRDEQSDPAAATSAARDLITRDGVNFLIGGVS